MYVPRNLYISISNFTKESKVTSISSISTLPASYGLMAFSYMMLIDRIKVGCMRAHSSVIPQWRCYDSTDV